MCVFPLPYKYGHPAFALVLRRITTTPTGRAKPLILLRLLGVSVIPTQNRCVTGPQRCSLFLIWTSQVEVPSELTLRRRIVLGTKYSIGKDGGGQYIFHGFTYLYVYSWFRSGQQPSRRGLGRDGARSSSRARVWRNKNSDLSR